MCVRDGRLKPSAPPPAGVPVRPLRPARGDGALLSAGRHRLPPGQHQRGEEHVTLRPAVAQPTCAGGAAAHPAETQTP